MRSAGSWLGATLAFLAELGSLAGLALWGFTVPGGWVARALITAGLPLAAALLWGLFAAPRARFRMPALVAAVKVAVQGGAVAALATTGHPGLAVVLGLAALAGQMLTSPPAGGPTRTGPVPPAGGSPTG